MVGISASGRAIDRPAADMLNKVITRSSATGPLSGMLIETELVRFRRVDTLKPNFRVANGNGVAVNDMRNTSSVPTLFEQAQLVERNSLVRGLWLLGK
jgi:hypothetical protein